MGSGPRFKFEQDFTGFALGIGVFRFPYSWTVGISLGFWDISYGFGKAYDAM